MSVKIQGFNGGGDYVFGGLRPVAILKYVKAFHDSLFPLKRDQ